MSFFIAIFTDEPVAATCGMAIPVYVDFTMLAMAYQQP